MIFTNINKVRTNTLITLSKKPINKSNDSNNYIFCNRCDSILGFELKYFQNKQNPNNKSTNDNNTYLLKKNIKERKNKLININLISFKENLLKSIKEEFNEIFKSMNNIKIKISLTPITKQNSNLFFILVSNEIDKKENNKIIEELIDKGGEEELDKYYKNDRIIFLDNYEIKEDIEKNKDWFISKINNIYGNNNRDFNSTNKYYMNGDKNTYILDKRKIDVMMEYLNNRDSKGHGCFS